MIVVSRGASRVVLLIGPWAVKLPRFGAGWRAGLCGLMSNMAEVQRWRAGPREGLCPVLWSVPGGWCVVMARCSPGVVPPHRAHLAGFDGWKPDSWGWHKGELVALDYHGDIYQEAA